MNIQTNLTTFCAIFKEKATKIGKNTEGVNKQTETDLKEISGDIGQKVAKIDKNTEGGK